MPGQDGVGNHTKETEEAAMAGVSVVTKAGNAQRSAKTEESRRRMGREDIASGNQGLKRTVTRASDGESEVT